MKHRFLLFLFLLSSIAVAAEQDKRVFITLDVSGSMQGNKYVLANYTTQMIMTLCGENDEIHLIVYGREKRFSKKSSSIKTIQKRYGSLLEMLQVVNLSLMTSWALTECMNPLTRSRTGCLSLATASGQRWKIGSRKVGNGLVKS